MFTPRTAARVMPASILKRGVALRSPKRLGFCMHFCGRAFRWILVVGVALSTTGSALLAVALPCIGHHAELMPYAEHDDCQDAPAEPCGSACPQANLLGHENDPDHCVCAVGLPASTLATQVGKTRLRSPWPCGVTFGQAHIAHLMSLAPTAIPGARAQRELSLLPLLRTVVLRI